MRKLKKEFMDDLQQKNGALHCLLRAVQNDDTLCLEIRENKVNIYYRGGNLCRIASRKDGYILEFDQKYAISDEHKEYVKGLSKWTPKEWVTHIPMLQSIMNANRPNVEDEFRQLVAWENNRSRICNDTDYYIADMQVFMQSKRGRRYIDMIAVNWPSTSSERRKKKERRLALVEVKYGDNSLKNDAGLLEHIRDWSDLLHDPKQWENLRKETMVVFNQKVQLGLIHKVPGEMQSLSDELPELILLLINHKPNNGVLRDEMKKIAASDEYRALRKAGCELKIATASHMGYGLYGSCMCPTDSLLRDS